MLSAGSNIASLSDTLKKVTVEYLYYSLRNPKPDVEARIRQLRIIRDLDKKQYSLLKRQLPYVVCGMFNPPYRKTENFAYTEYFIVDIDHFSEKGFDIQATRKQIESDERVLLSFISPGEDGLKVLFKLKNRCYDAEIYKLFYKSFLRDFALMYHLEQVLDERTCDVCRACFISIDSNVFYREEAVPVDLNAYLPVSDTVSMFDLKYELECAAKEQKASTVKEEKMKDPEKEVLDKIKGLLNPKSSNSTLKKKPYVPEYLEEIMTDLKKYIEETGVEVYEIINIQYAKKIRCKVGLRMAEINLFYGKHGFSVVQSPRCGTSEELNHLISELIMTYLSTI
ncbi:CRISPR-associated primase-polymerase type B [uncultured Bacteroides sp.]|jgi:virE N-domain protein|uniref:CRISPR-associated primase-polymerase type B n=1 Tax=uncultured Bacteroides sp. TaxID=162156 RepID=UPI00261012FA|nr:CRISPR-associated primase-polymerase type B [uncultured Bacteroides sp.]